MVGQCENIRQSRQVSGKSFISAADETGLSEVPCGTPQRAILISFK